MASQIDACRSLSKRAAQTVDKDTIHVRSYVGYSIYGHLEGTKQAADLVCTQIVVLFIHNSKCRRVCIFSSVTDVKFISQAKYDHQKLNHV